MKSASQAVVHHFTVDVEEYFQVAAMEPHVDRADWDRIPSRVVDGVHQLLDLLAAHGDQGTFFILGWVAARQPDLVREIARAGHEIASHGWGHERLTQLSRDQFRESVRTSKDILEQVAGQRVLGYRAPSFSIVHGGEWAWDILIEEGYRYDSSLFPVRRSGSGYVGGARDPHVLTRVGGALHEFPPATLEVAGRVLPAGGGAYFRLFPPALIRAALASAARRGVPATFYIHPWELDPEQPRIRVPFHTRVRHYGGLSRSAGRLRALFDRYRFQSIARGMTAMEAHGG